MYLSDSIIQTFLTKFPAAKINEPMRLHTFLKIGGPAQIYFVAETSQELVRAVQGAIALQIPWAVIGGGSNLLVSDEGYNGLVIQAADRSTKIEGMEMTAAAGAFTGSVARACVDVGLLGFEWGVGVPGTIGGATYGNAGCFGGEMKDVVSNVHALRVADGADVTYTNQDCRFGYRDSRFKHEKHVILETTLSLQRGDVSEGKLKIDAIMQKRKDSQPQGSFSAGCLFKNFEFTNLSDIEKLQQEMEVPEAFIQRKNIPAGWLIDQLGLKGKTIGKAQVSPVHGNFLVNLGGATAGDVLSLSSYVKMKVRDDLGVLLEDEVQLLGF